MIIQPPKPVQWFAIRSNIRCEKRAEAGLREQEFDVYLPSLTKWCRHSRRKTKVQRPLLVRYLFVALSRDEPEFYKVRQTNGVEAIIGTLGQPIPVPVKWIEEMRTAETQGLFDETLPTNPELVVTPGLAVRVIGGPFTGFMAEIMDAKTADGRVRVLVKGLFGAAPKPMQIDVAKLEAA